MKNKLILVVAFVVLILGGALLLNNKSNNTGTDTTNTVTNENQNQDTTKPVEGKDVTVANNGFEPQTVTIKAGQRVVWTNKSGGPVSVNSDSHPTHLMWPFLNLGKFENDASVSVVFEKAGKYTYHNHLNADQTGTVIVE